MKAEDAMELIHIAIKAVVTQILSPIMNPQSAKDPLQDTVGGDNSSNERIFDAKLFSVMTKIVEKEVQQYMALSSSRI